MRKHDPRCFEKTKQDGSARHVRGHVDLIWRASDQTWVVIPAELAECNIGDGHGLCWTHWGSDDCASAIRQWEIENRIYATLIETGDA